MRRPSTKHSMVLAFLLTRHFLVNCRRFNKMISTTRSFREGSWICHCLLFFTLIVATAATASPLNINDILVDAQLDYGTFRGAYSAEYNITYWKTIPFAAPPVGVNRFRGPQPLTVHSSLPTTVINASRPFPMCPQRETSGDEDCLYLGLYGRPWTAEGQRANRVRPVVVVFHGGGFIRGSGRAKCATVGLSSLERVFGRQ